MIKTRLRLTFFVGAFLFVAAQSMAQEICNNGIDDDGDGFIDCYDADCASNPDCADFFVGLNPDCESIPTAFPTFSITNEWSSNNRTATNNSLPSIGDIDGDGIPEVMSTNYTDRKVFVLSGIDGSILHETTLVGRPYLEVSHADIDRDGCAEIFVPTASPYGITALSCDLQTVLWTATTVHRAGNIGIADFDEDGFAEIYSKDEIFDAHTGTKMRASDFNNNAASAAFVEKNITSGGVAVNMLEDAECADCGGLEYVLGGRIYSVSINRGALTATMTLERSIDYSPLYIAPWEQNRSATSVADFNKDGFIDVVAIGRTAASTLTRVFFWDVQNNVVQTYVDPAYNWNRGAGRPNIGDIDGDGQLNITYVSGQYLYALREDMTLLWRSTIVEVSSGTTGTTIYDFNGDGNAEIVYRDENFLYIVNGVDGTFFQSIPCKSLTFMEYPIVADLDADGSTEICVSCLTNDGGNLNDNELGQIRVYKSNGEQWVPSRRIWNQHAYFNVNINDDGTVPIQMQDQALVFSNGICDTPGDITPLNAFLNQSPYITTDGCRNYAAANLKLDGNIMVSSPQCPSTNFTVSFDLSNDGDIALQTVVPITFYSGDPTLGTSVKLNTVNELVSIDIGQTITVGDFTVLGPGGNFTLFVSVNDDGSENPPVVFPVGNNVLECDYSDNIGSTPVEPGPFTLNIQKLTDNNKCNPAQPDNGSANVSASGLGAIYFEDFEDLAINTTNDSGSTPWSRTRASGTDYAEVRSNSGKNFEAKDTDGQVVWSSGVVDISTFTNINGSITLSSASLNGTIFEADDFIRAFYKLDGGPEIPMDNGIFTGAVGPTVDGTGADSEIATVTGLLGSTMQIIVRMDNNSNDERYYIDDIAIQGIGNLTAGYTSNWFYGTTAAGAPDFVGVNNTGMADGIWTVFATNPAAGCGSDTVQVTIDLVSVSPTVNIVIVNQFTNCQAPDGQLLAEVNGGAPASDFDFEWYEGVDVFTSPVLGINALASNLDPTTYTVLVTEKASGCQTISSATVPASASFPVVTPQVDSNVTDCLGGDGSVSAVVAGFGLLWLEDFEDLSNGTDDDTGSTAWSVSGNPNGYAEVRSSGGSQVFEVSNSDTEITYSTEVIDISAFTNISISVDLNATSNLESNRDYVNIFYVIDGGAEIPLNNGQHAGNFTPVQAVATNLNGSTIQIVARIFNTSSTERHRLDNISISGNGIFSSGYTFDWYDGPSVKPSADYTGLSVTGLTAGDYTVTATSAATGCTSSPATVTITDNTNTPMVTASILSEQTSCDPANPNGSFTANVGGLTAGFTFNWFSGQNTSPVNELAGSPAFSLTGLSSGIYTVLATDDVSGCFSSTEITISDVLPTIVGTPSAVDLTSCSPLNGELSATAVNGSAPYEFLWYLGTVGTPDLTSPDFTGASATGQDAGDYTLVVRDANLCVSAAEYISIIDATTPVVINEVLTDQTSCDPAAPNGTVTLTATPVDTYAFNVYDGQNTNPVNEVAGSPGASISGLAAGIYTILATSTTTGCFITEEVTIIDNITLPVPNVTVTDASACGPLNGALAGDVGGDNTNFTFHWFDGIVGGTPDITTADFNGVNYTALAPGDYTVVAVDNATQCESLPIVSTIADITVPIVINEVLTDQTSCDPAAQNGTITLTATPVDTYTFNVYDGQNTNPVNEVASSPGASISGLAPGIYTILATSTTTGCFITEEVTIIDNITLPVPNVTVTDASACAPLLNGALAGDVGGDNTNYTFHWFDGIVGGTPDITTADFNGVNYTALAPGDYTVVAVDNATLCESLPVVSTVADITVPIVINEVLTDQSSCDPAAQNGTITLTATPVDTYTFNVYDGQNTNPVNEVASSPSASISGLAPGIYTILATSTTTGCFITEEVTIIDNITLPIPNVTVTDASACSPLNGALAGDVGGDNTNFSFHWFDGIVGGTPDITTADFNGVNYTALAPGNYTVVAVDNATQCESLPVVSTVADITVPIVISEVLTEQTSCNAAAPNGAIVASALPADTYTFNVYDGQNTNPANEVTGSPSASISGLAAGIYTIMATSTTTGCFETKEVTIIENSIVPTINLIPIANTVCDPVFVGAPNNGSVTAAITDPNGSLDFVNDYTFSWTDASMTPVVDGNPATILVLDNVPGGDYNLVVTNDVLGCSSVITTTTVDDTPPTIEIGSVNIASTNCLAAANGQITAFVDANSNGSLDPGEDDIVNYTYEWYVGLGTGGANTATQAGNPNIAIDLQGGAGQNYTVRIIENVSGCDNTFSVLLNDNSVIPNVSLSATDNTICDPLLAATPFDGTITATVADPNGSLDFVNDYTFTWTDGAMAPVVDGDPLTPLVLDNVQGGTYNLVLTNDVLGCSSVLVTTTVNDAPPTIDIGSVSTPSTNCAGIGNGSIQAYFDANSNGSFDPGEDDLVNYTYEWHVGLGVAGALTNTQPGNPNIAIDLQGGIGQNYTVRIIDNATGCDNTLSVLLNDAQVLPVVTLTPADNKGCTPGNYSGSVAAIVTYQGVDVTASGDYTFNWTSSDGAFVSVDAATINNLKGSETYTLSAVNSVIGCTALDVTATVNDNSDPIIIFFDNTTNTSCDVTGNGAILAGIDTNGNGTYEPGIDDNLANLGDYNFTWHVGNTTTGTLPASIPAANQIDQLDGNLFYTLEVEMISTGCVATLTQFVQRIITTPSITVSANDYLDCNTDIQMSVVIDNLASFAPLNDPATDFSYTWYSGSSVASGTLLPAAGFSTTATGAILSTIDGATELYADDYTVVVQHINSSCIAPEETDRVNEPPLLFDIVPTLDQPATDCSNASGKVWVSVANNASAYNATGPFTYEWFEGAPTNTVPVRYYSYDGISSSYIEQVNVPTNSLYTDPAVMFGANAGEVDGVEDIGGNGADATLSGVLSGIYTVLVTDQGNGCQEYITVEVPFVGTPQNNVVTVFHDTDCTADNGTISVDLQPGGGALTLPSQYTIYLFEGTNPSLVFDTDPGAGTFLDVQIGTDPIGTGNSFGNGTNGIFLTPGQAYTIASIPTAGGSRCWSVPSTVSIEEWANDPSVNLSGTITANTSCDLAANGDGSLTLDVQHNPDEDWYGTVADPEPTYEISAISADLSLGNNVTLGPGLAVGLHTLNNLGPTVYTITITSSRGCSTVQMYTIPDQPVIAEVTGLTITSTTSCVPANGGIEITSISQIITGTPFNTDDFFFDWTYDANLDGIFNDALVYSEAGNAPGAGNIFDSSDPGFAGPGIYWVVMSATVGAGLGCESAPQQFEIENESVVPTFVTDVTPNTSCVAGPDGTIFIDPDRNGATLPFTTWSIAFTADPSGTLGAPAFAPAGEGGTFSASGLVNGQYDFIITDDATGCNEIGSVSISNNPVTPVLSTTGYAISDQLSCNPDGAITISEIETVTSGIAGNPSTAPGTSTDLVMANYEFTWYYDANTNGIFDDAATRVSIAGGGATNGQLYQFGDPGFAGAGIYWVEITKVATNPGEGGLGCTSVPVQFEVEDVSVNPTFVYDVTSNTGCALIADGSLFIDPDRNSAVTPFTTWSIAFGADPSGTLGAPVFPAGEAATFSASGLVDGQYDFTITDDATGCSISGSLIISNNPVAPILTTAGIAVVDQVSCTPDGSITVTQIETIASGIAGNPSTPPAAVSDVNMTNYSFTWYFDANGNGVLDDVATRSNIVGGGATNGDIYQVGDAGFVGAGTYWVEATKIGANPAEGAVGCTSSPIEVEIDDLSTNPAPALVLTMANTNCPGAATFNGQLTASVPGFPVGDYTYSWFTGSNNTTPADALPAAVPGSSIIGANGEIADGLAPGFYTVQVLDNLNPDLGCTGIVSLEVTSDLPIISIAASDISITDQNDCSPFNGLAEVTDITVDGATIGGVGGYTFEWLQADGVTPIVGAGAAALIATNLDGGPVGGTGIDYVVRATNSASNCLSTQVAFTINNIAVSPFVIETANSPNTNCVGAPLMSGMLTIDIDAGAPAGNYTIEWFPGNDDSTPLAGAVPTAIVGGGGLMVSQLPAGPYTVRVTDNVNPGVNCLSLTTFTILDDLPIISIAASDISITDQNDCSPFNGLAEVTDITVDGATIGGVGGYTFEWLQADGVTPIAGAGTGALIATNLDGGPVGGTGIDYVVRATNSASNCLSTQVAFTINNIAVSPFVIETANSPNTNCVGAPLMSGMLTIDIDAGAPAGNYTIEWFQGNDDSTPLAGAVPTAIVGGGGLMVSQLPAGPYTVRVTDNVNPGVNCLSLTTFTILDDLPIISIAASDINITDQNDCSPFNGLAEVTDITVDGATIGGVGGYTFEWLLADGVTPIAGAGTGALIATNLDGGPVGGTGIDYVVRATNSASNCLSTQVAFTINNIAVSPFVIETANSPNTNCVGAPLMSGMLTIDIDAGAPAGNYTIEWFQGNDDSTPLAGAVPTAIVGGGGLMVSQLPAGPYTVRVTDNVNPGVNCLSLTTFTILDDLPIISIAASDINITDQNDCSPFNGLAEVTDITVDGATIGGVGGYTFEWLQADGVTPIAGAGTGALIATNLDGGPVGGTGIDYVVRATNSASNCLSTQVAFTINNVAVSPFVIETANNPNTNCMGVIANGMITIDIDASTPAANYTIQWFQGNDDSTPLAGAVPTAIVSGGGLIVSQLPAGQYTVRVIDLVNPGIGCISLSTFTIIDDLPIISISVSDIALTANANCVMPNGTATVLSVSEDGVPMPTAGYTFEWFDANLVSLGPASPANSIANLVGGTYFLNIINTVSNCAITPPFEFMIEDLTAPPVITLFGFANPTQCDGVNALGLLRVMADGSTNTTDYNFEWYAGGIPVVGPPLVLNNFELINQPAGDYTVVATNNSTGCTSEETYTLVIEVTELQMAISSSPITSCMTDDGSVFAAVSNSSGTFNFSWYIGEDVKAVADYTTQQVNNLSSGDYTVVAVDQSDPSCTAGPLTVFVEDIRVFPEPTIIQDNPLTNCDPNNPNAQLSASTSIGTSGFTFEWRVGIDSTSAVPSYVGPTYSNLAAGDYTVVVTNDVSGCSKAEIYTILDESIPIIDPTATVLSNLTSCTTPNGMIDVSVDGITSEYIFNWYIGQTVNAVPDYTGNIVSGLGIGFYTVTATNKVSGCISNSVTVEVLEEVIYPEFNIITGPSVCAEPTGFAKIEFLSGYAYDKVEWIIGSDTVEAPGIYDLDPGSYPVLVTGAGSCVTEGVAVIGTDILVYNGLSPNSDDANDIWVIDCIQTFENNNVKIFNRNGQLVYETDNYDNGDISFTGEGNRGIYIGKKNVPDGTYFYIIAKGDGSELKSGFLELIR